MPTETAIEVIETYTFASSMGSIPIRVLVDAETGEKRTLAFVRGAPLLYREFVGMLLAVLGTNLNNMGDHTSIKETLPLWSRVKLGSMPRDFLRASGFSKTVVRRVVRAAVHERTGTDGTGMERLRGLVRELEEAHAEAIEDPITVTGLAALWEPLIYTPTWTNPSEKAEETGFATANAVSMIAQNVISAIKLGNVKARTSP